MRLGTICGMLVALLTASSSAQAQSEHHHHQQEKWLKHLRLMIEEDPKADILIETESGQITAALKKGDPELAKSVIRASGRMLDNESLTSMVIAAVVYNPESAVPAIQGLEKKERTELVSVLAGVEGNCSPSEFKKLTETLGRVSGGAETQPSQTGGAGRQAVINDPDGYTNVREKPDKTSPVVTTVKKGVVFTVVKEKGDWCYVETRFGETGYMHLSRVRFLK